MSENLQRYLPFVPVVIAGGVIIWSMVSSFLQGHEPTRSRGTAQMGDSIEDQTHLQIMKEIDPIDSVYFDLSVARHMLEEGKKEEVKKWLEAGAAIDELSRSWHAGFITPEEARTKSVEIGKIIDMISANKQEEALRELIRLQDWASEKAYSAYTEEAKKRGMDPQRAPIPAKIDAKFEPIRERKEAEWRAKGYPPGMIERALGWAEEYSIGMSTKITSDPEFRYRIQQELYPKALDMAEKWITGFLQFVEG
jgi:hypothetical protein